MRAHVHKVKIASFALPQFGELQMLYKCLFTHLGGARLICRDHVTCDHRQTSRPGRQSRLSSTDGILHPQHL